MARPYSVQKIKTANFVYGIKIGGSMRQQLTADPERPKGPPTMDGTHLVDEMLWVPSQGLLAVFHGDEICQVPAAAVKWMHPVGNPYKAADIES